MKPHDPTLERLAILQEIKDETEEDIEEHARHILEISVVKPQLYVHRKEIASRRCDQSNLRLRLETVDQWMQELRTRI